MRDRVADCRRASLTLRLEQIGFAASQLLFRLIARIDVCREVVPTDDALAPT